MRGAVVMSYGSKPVALCSVFAALALSAPDRALADPVVGPGGKPSVVTEWKTEGATVVLRVADAFDPNEVAKAVGSGVPGVTTKIRDRDVVVSGMPESQLVLALEKIDVSAKMDDVDAMLAALQAPGGGEGATGSSIRATRATDFSDIMGARGAVTTGRVVRVRRANFPLVLVTIAVSKAPEGASGPKRGEEIVVLARVKSRDGIIDPMDKASQLNVGAWYAEVGDTVDVRLEKRQENGVWLAAGYERRVGAKPVR